MSNGKIPKKKSSKIYAPVVESLIIDTSDSSDEQFEENQIMETIKPVKQKKNPKMTKPIADVEYKGDIKNTFTSHLTKEEITDLLDGYTKITDVNDIKKGYHIRYFIKDPKTGENLFRMGGNAINIQDEYVVLSNGCRSWSVQKYATTTFFQQTPMSEVIKLLNDQFDDKKSNMMDIINILKQKNKDLVQNNKDLQNEVLKHNKQIKKLEAMIKKLQK
jgi:hypothetical protein